MNGLKIAEKSLVVKVDAKTKKILDDYIIERSKKNGDEKPPEGEAVEKYMDEDLVFEDGLATDRIGQILQDHSQEIENFVPKEVSTQTLIDASVVILFEWCPIAFMAPFNSLHS